MVLIVSACGGGGSSSSSEGSTPAAGSGSAQVSVSNVDGIGDVLVDPQGEALYASEQEANGMVRCTDACLSFWDPLTLPNGVDAPSAASDVQAQVGALQRPDGSEQVTLEGRPLYRFTEDTGPGVVTRDGFEDSFSGRTFRWHVATPTGISDGASTTPATPPSDPYGNGG